MNLVTKELKAIVGGHRRNVTIRKKFVIIEYTLKMEDNRTGIDLKENRARMGRGELYYAFVPDLSAERSRCEQACIKYNDAKDLSRRQRAELWRQ